MVESTISNGQNTDIIIGNEVLEMLYDGKEAEGFDMSTGSEWIYPTNYPVRAYQKNIVSNALFKNTLVCLPTGLGKTFIAAVVMYNYHRWYPRHLVVFMAHSKPLVTQQVNACCNIMGISPSLIAELNGNMHQATRKKQWETKKIFFLTPQVFNNDLVRGNVKAEDVRCIVIDEAHKALGNQAYCQVMKSVKPFNSNFRVLALSATPGDDMNMVRKVIENLMISHLELRNENDPDIKPYLHEKKIETIVVKLNHEISDLKEKFLKAVDKYIQPLVRHKLLPRNFNSFNPYSLVLKQKQIIQDPSIAPELRGVMLSNLSVSIALFHALEELVIHGMRSFVTKLKSLQSGEGTTNKSHSRIAHDDDIKSLIDHVEIILGPDQNISFDGSTSLTRIFDEVDNIDTSSKVVYSHPKFEMLEKIIRDHFEKFKDSTRVIVFCKSRQCTGEICNFLARFKPQVKPMIFIGQSQTTGGIVTKGFNQAAQLTVMKRFREGVYNTLIATCVAEEGLDIGEVDLIVNFDSGKNSNTQVQRSGRTGRKRDGRVVNLVTEGKEHHNYNISVSKGVKMSKKLVSSSTNLPFYLGNPRLLPKGINPVCQEMFLSAKTINEEEPKEKKKRGKGVKKKLEDSDDNPAKRPKGSPGDSGRGSSLWTMLTDKKTKDKKDCAVGENSPLNGKFNDTNDVKTDGCDEIEIIEIEDDPQMVLYDDDVDENLDEPWESISDEQLHDKETTLVKEFLRVNNKMLKPKNNLRDLLNLNRINKYCKLLETSNTDLIEKMKNFEDVTLSDSDKKCLSDKMDMDVLEASFNSSRIRLLTGEDKNTSSTAKPVQDNFVFDIDPNEFLNPFDDFLQTGNAEMISSTPLRCTENLMPPARSSPVVHSSIQGWNDSDFFNLKENISPKKNGNVSCCERQSSAKKKDSTLISITQAINIVNNTETDCSKKKKEGVEPKTEVPESPVLFISQKQKPQNNFLPVSPILTQGSSGKKWSKSRKCLNFRDDPKGSTQNNSVFEDKPKEPVNNMVFGDDSDLFTETELYLANNMDKLEENLRKIEEEAATQKRAEKVPITDGLSGNSEEFGLGQLNLDGISDLDKSDVETGCISPDPQKVSISKEKVIEEMGLSQFNVNSVMSGKVETPLRKSTPFRSSPKKSVRLENTLVSCTSAANALVNEKKKEKEPSPVHDFSFFRDDDFDVEFLKVDTTEKRQNIVENDASSDSDIFGKDMLSPAAFLSPEENEEEHGNDDGELSDGAIEAIKAVEMFEKDVKTAKKLSFMNSDSEDSFNFCVPILNTKRTKHPDEPPQKKCKKSPKEKKKKKKRKNEVLSPGLEYVEKEAEISRDVEQSSDEENTSGLDSYDSSFVDEMEVTEDVDMTAKYLESVKETAWARGGVFKIPKSKVQNDTNVFSQIGSEGDSEYEKDSFCVSEGESENSSYETSLNKIKKKRKRMKNETPGSDRKKKLKKYNGGSVKKKKFRRVRQIESDSEDEVVEIVETRKAASVEEIMSESEAQKIEELFRSPFSVESPDASSREENIPMNVFIGSRQIASAPEITTRLRAEWNVNVHVRSAPDADYIVSWRVGISRISLADFSSGSPAIKSSLKEMLLKMTTNFQQAVLIVENDKKKELPLTVGSQRIMWAKHSMRTLVKTLNDNVKIIFSKDKGETAKIIVNLCKEENKKGEFINIDGDIDSDMEKKLKFYSSLPGVNVANALRICGKFTSISSFMNCCDSVNRIARELGLKKETAANVYRLLFTTTF